MHKYAYTQFLIYLVHAYEFFVSFRISCVGSGDAADVRYMPENEINKYIIIISRSAPHTRSHIQGNVSLHKVNLRMAHIHHRYTCNLQIHFVSNFAVRFFGIVEQREHINFNDSWAQQTHDTRD